MLIASATAVDSFYKDGTLVTVHEHPWLETVPTSRPQRLGGVLYAYPPVPGKGYHLLFCIWVAERGPDIACVVVKNILLLHHEPPPHMAGLGDTELPVNDSSSVPPYADESVRPRLVEIQIK